MRDVGSRSEEVQDLRPVGCSEGLVFEEIDRLVAHRKLGAACVLDHLVEVLALAACRMDAAALPEAVSALRHARVTDMALICDYIPEAARRLGQGWQDDTLSFLDVTMGVSRLHELLREVGGTWKGDDAQVAGRPTVLLVVPPGEQHTLGATVLACLMRHHGVSVCLRLAPGLTELAALVATRGFEGAMVTLGNTDRVESCAVLVRALGKGGLPVVVGGSALDMEPDLQALTGADLATNSLEAALALFGVVEAQKT